MKNTKISSAKIKKETDQNNHTYFSINNKKQKKFPRCKSAYITTNSPLQKRPISSFIGMHPNSNKNIGMSYNDKNNIKLWKPTDSIKEIGLPFFSSKNSTSSTFNILYGDNKSNDFKKVDSSIYSSYSKSKKISYDNYFLGRAKSNIKGKMNNSLSIKNINFENKNDKNKNFIIKTRNEINIQKLLNKPKKSKPKSLNSKDKEEEIIKKVNVYDNIPFLFIYAKRKEIENEKSIEMSYNKNNNVRFHNIALKKISNGDKKTNFPVKYCFLNGTLNNILHSVKFIDIKTREESQKQVKIKNNSERNNNMKDFKTFGYEMDPNLLSKKNQEIKQQKIKEQLENFKNQTNEIKFHYNKINDIYNIKKINEEKKIINKEKVFYKQLFQKYKKKAKKNKNKDYNSTNSKNNNSFYKSNNHEEICEEVKVKKDRNYIRSIFTGTRSNSVINNIIDEYNKDSNDKIDLISPKQIHLNNEIHENNEASEKSCEDYDEENTNERIQYKIKKIISYARKFYSSKNNNIRSYINNNLNNNSNNIKNKNNFQIINYFGPSDIINYKSSGKHIKKRLKKTKSSKKIKLKNYTNKIKNKQDNEMNQKEKDTKFGKITPSAKKSLFKKNKEDYYEYEYIYEGSNYSSSEKNSASNRITSISNRKKNAIKNKIISKKTESSKTNNEKQKNKLKNKEKNKERKKNKDNEKNEQSDNTDSSDISSSNENKSISNSNKNLSADISHTSLKQHRTIKTIKENSKSLSTDKNVKKIKKYNKNILFIQKEITFQINEIDTQTYNTQEINQSIFDFNKSGSSSEKNSNKKNNISKYSDKEHSIQKICGTETSQKKNEESSRYTRRKALIPLDKDLIEYAIKDYKNKNLNEAIHQKYKEIEKKKIADLEDFKDTKFSFNDVNPNSIKDIEIQKEILLYQLEEDIKSNIKQGKYDYHDLGDFQKFEYNLKSGMSDAKNKWQKKKYIVSLVRRFNEFQEQLNIKEIQKQDEERINNFIRNLNNLREKIPMIKYHKGRKCHSTDYTSSISILSQLLKLYL